MKIALISPYDFSYPGGVTVHISHLFQHFTGKGHQVKILAPSSLPDNPPNFISLGRPVPVPSGGSVARVSLSIWLQPKLRQFLDQEAFDVVHLHEPLAPILPLTVLHSSHALNVGTFHAFHGKARLYGLGRTILSQWMEMLDGRIAVSRPAMEYVCRYFPGQYEIIPNGIDYDHFSAPKDPLSELSDGKVNILFVGRLEKRKGLKYLLGAFGRLKWDYPNLRLMVVGPGTPDEDSAAILSERALKDVVFFGEVTYEDLPRYYQAAHIFCTPATGKESFGMVLLEAMAAGKPVVASNIEGYASLLDHGEEGLLVKPKDESALAEALAILLKDPKLAERMGEKGRAKAQGYRWSLVAERVLDYYQRVAYRAQLGSRAFPVASGPSRLTKRL